MHKRDIVQGTDVVLSVLDVIYSRLKLEYQKSAIKSQHIFNNRKFPIMKRYSAQSSVGINNLLMAQLGLICQIFQTLKSSPETLTPSNFPWFLFQRS